MWIIIISLITIGLVLFVVEVIFIPGTTVVGILGLVFMAVGVVISYRHFGSNIGLYVLVGAATGTLAALIYSFRSGAWEKYSLKDAISSKVNEGLTARLTVGDEGLTVSTLRPSGKAEFNNELFEVRTSGHYLNPGTRVRIVSIEGLQIVVEEATPKEA